MKKFDPEDDLRGAIKMVVAAGLLIFRSNVYGAGEAFKVAEEFVKKAEEEVGRLNP